MTSWLTVETTVFLFTIPYNDACLHWNCMIELHAWWLKVGNWIGN